jgi:O-antigen/teichoic acid export membrane protein
MAGETLKGEIARTFKSVLPNITSLILTEVVYRSVNFITNIFIARYFSVAEFGKLGFITSIISYFILAIDFGFDLYGIREVAKAPQKWNFFFDKILNVKLFLGSLTFLVIIISSLFFQGGELRILYILFGLTVITTSINLSWYYKAVEKMQVVFRAKSFGSLLYIILIFVLTISFQSILIIPVALFLSNLFEYFIYRKRLPGKLVYNFEGIGKKVKTLYGETFIIGLSSFFILIYYNLDMVMLGFYKSQLEVGIYNSAYKIFLIFIIPLQLILTAFFPRLSQYKPSRENSFKSLFYAYSFSLIILAVVLFFILFYFSGDLIYLAFGSKYSGAQKPLSILALNILVIGLNIALGNPLVAWGEQKKYIIAIAMGAITNIILNFILIPQYSYNGAAFATLLSEVAVFIGLVFVFNIYYSKSIRQNS